MHEGSRLPFLALLGKQKNQLVQAITGDKLAPSQPSQGNPGGGGGGKPDGKGKGKGKKKNKPRSASRTPAVPAAASDANTQAEEIKSLRRMLSAPKWCANFLKDKCEKGDSCRFPHMDPATVHNVKISGHIQKDERKAAAAATRAASSAHGY